MAAILGAARRSPTSSLNLARHPPHPRRPGARSSATTAPSPAASATCIGNVTVVQSYTRLAAEMQAMRGLMDELLAAQYPVLTWWGLLPC